MSPRLTVLNVAYSLAPVGPDAVGGAEQVLTQLDAALVRAGHRSLVLACEASLSEDTLLTFPLPRGSLNESAREAARQNCRTALATALKRWPIDLVHMHGIDFHQYLPGPGVPTLVTLHLPPQWYPPEIFRLTRPHTFLHCVSESQQRACPPCEFLLPPIENGVPPDLFDAPHAKRRFALCLGRICPEKGFHLALEAAARAQFPLLLAGKAFQYAAHETYFAREIAPRLDRQRRFIGPVGRHRKRRLLSAASCLLVPSLAPETSSLVAMEALACGTPVIAFPSGALSDIIEHGRTGFLVKDTKEMADALPAANSLSAAICRSSAQARFGLQRMVDQYLQVYTRLAALNRGYLLDQAGHALEAQPALATSAISAS